METGQNQKISAGLSRLKNAFSTAAGNGWLFLAGSTALVYAGLELPDTLQAAGVMAGGVGLGTGAVQAIRKKFKQSAQCTTAACLPLAASGIYGMIMHPDPETGLFWANALFLSLNAWPGWGVLNPKSWAEKISPEGHGAGSIIPASMVTLAGILLDDTLTIGIGAAFLTDAFARANNGDQPFVKACKEAAYHLRHPLEGLEIIKLLQSIRLRAPNP